MLKSQEILNVILTNPLKMFLQSSPLRLDAYSELSSHSVKAHMDGVFKVRGGGDLRPVLVPILFPTCCR